MQYNDDFKNIGLWQNSQEKESKKKHKNHI